jgi:hypothetical protein
LDTSTLPPNILVPIAGVATDKILALRGESSLTIRHDHFHSITKETLLVESASAEQTAPAGSTAAAPQIRWELPEGWAPGAQSSMRYASLIRPNRWPAAKTNSFGFSK